MSTYLLEVGTEELPYKFIPQAIEQVKTSFSNFFKSNGIKFESLDVYATPRRLALIVKGLADKQPDVEKVVKGPIKKVAYDENGNLSKAGIGFSKKNGVEEKDLYVENDYLFAKIFVKGKNTEDLIKENASNIILKLQGSHFMRWAGFDVKFSRPIRWVVSLLDNKEIPIQIIDKKSSKMSRGHRFSKNKEIEINSPDEYLEKLRNANVIVDQDERQKRIIELTKKEADKLGLQTKISADLLEEVTYICEWPVPVICEFKPEYLKIPQMVTVTVMETHQRYFALYDSNGKLSNKFITITNFVGDDFTNIKAGNERVITARLDDAIFFFNEDTKKSFDSYVEQLKGVTFQKGMGSVFDKTKRLIKLSELLANKANANVENVKRTALLCKADLTTGLVCEFTELQGFIGSDYAKISGENDAVSMGIKEHYFPINAESELAEGIEGQLVGIADKIDTISAVFAAGKKPTGSSDPLGVRRAALGIIKTIINKQLNINLTELTKETVKLLPNKTTNDEDLTKQIEEFIIQRLVIFLADNYKKEILESCSKNTTPLTNLCDYVNRVELVTKLLEDKTFAPILESTNRISRIIKESIETTVNKDLFTTDAERELFKAIEQINTTSYETIIEGLRNSNSAIEKFFNDVLVMDKNEKIKNNRIAMLSMLKKEYEKIADFTTLQM
ncbi:glycine--tRNA ligase subunit beta [bacterium]|nr:glycine--tRNA ligase subunit beta [bacterium]